jgi:hypothetical protein
MVDNCMVVETTSCTSVPRLVAWCESIADDRFLPSPRHPKTWSPTCDYVGWEFLKGWKEKLESGQWGGVPECSVS